MVVAPPPPAHAGGGFTLTGTIAGDWRFADVSEREWRAKGKQQFYVGTSSEYTLHYCSAMLYAVVPAKEVYIDPRGDYWAYFVLADGTTYYGDPVSDGTVVQLTPLLNPHQFGAFPPRQSKYLLWTNYNDEVYGGGDIPPESYFGGGVGVRFFSYSYEWKDYTNPNITDDDDTGCTDGYINSKLGAGRQVFDSESRWVTQAPSDDQAPEASFSYTVSDTDPLEVSFANLSSDPDGDSFTSAWDFGDDKTSSAESPVHRYDTGGTYEVTLTVTDPSGKTGTEKRQVVVDQGLIVNSTGDGAALDPAAHGCDTGGVVGDAPECTLRAAIETANDRGGGAITFGIDGGGVPTIALDSPLPPITGADTSVDATTQASGQVAVDGGGVDSILDVQATGVTLEGLVLDHATEAVSIRKDASAEVLHTVIGADPTGTTPGEVATGIETFAGAAEDISIHDNVIGAATGIVVGSDGVSISSNHIGVSAGGTTTLSSTQLGAVVGGAHATLADNTVWATVEGIEVAATGSTTFAGDAAVTGNRVGVGVDGSTVLTGMGEGIRVDGAPRARVTGNVVTAGREAGISIIGALEVINDGGLQFTTVEDGGVTDGPVTGGHATVSGNTVGAAAIDASAPAEHVATAGILVWDNAPDVTVTDNTVAGEGKFGIDVHGGAGHVISGNRVGYDTAGNAAASLIGIRANGTDDITVGKTGAGNRVLSRASGIGLLGTSTGVTVTANTVTAGSGANTDRVGLLGDVDVSGVRASDNEVVGFTVGIGLVGNGVSVSDNTVSDGRFGIQTFGSAAKITHNTVTGATKAAISSEGKDGLVKDNLVGVKATGAAAPIIGNPGAGINVTTGGSATVTDNIVAGSGGHGIGVDANVVATLKGNRIVQTTGAPIAYSGSPAPPTIDAVIQTHHGDSTRTTLLLTVPAGGGTVEIFANHDCADPEAEKVLHVTRQVAPDATTRLVQLIDRPGEDNFTATFTDTAGHTSGLSACEAIGTYPDTDGDGAPDPFDAVIGAQSDPTKAVVVTDSESLLALSVVPLDEQTGVGGGTLTDVNVVDAPAPTDGFTLPYGTITFTVEGLELGGSTVVSLTTIEGEAAMVGDSYWKYGPETKGGTPHWYRFDLDESTHTGAQVGEPVDVPGLGTRRSFNLYLTDGARGDTNGFTDGRIVDPGGPAIVTAAPPPDPGVSGSAPTTPVASTDPGASPAPTSTLPSAPTPEPTSTPTPAPIGERGVLGSSVPAAPSPAAAGSSENLASTGFDVVPTLGFGALLLVAGLGAARAGRRSRRRTS